ncbi:DNA-binding protein [Streptomyces anulatus]|uniref:DNA-binding protein n=1 Tax=Streptomyces anulatus TaxID=1892 RepID=UPI002F90D132|nr:DNA-binding protein [Streptomyces anulatus]
MIPHGRPALDLDSVARRAGVSPATFDRNHRKAFRAAVKPLPGSKRPLLYDAAQVDAHLSGKSVPPLPTEPDPSDLLTDAEVGAIAGVTASTIRYDATTGLIAAGRELHGRRWWTRAEAEARATRKPQYKGRTPGARDKTPRSRRPDQRVDEIAAELHQAAAGHRGPVNAGVIAVQYGVSTRTAERLMAKARAAGQGSTEESTT